MSAIEKKRNSSKESLLKLKPRRLRFSNIKNMNGRRKSTEDSNEKDKDKSAKEYRKLAQNLSILSIKNYPQITAVLPQEEVIHEKALTITDPYVTQDCESVKPRRSFDDHIAQWSREFCKPLTLPSTKCEFDMPYCYSEEFYNKMAAKCYLMQPFCSIGEPVEAWHSDLDVWYEKSQLALQYYRQLCVQPSRGPSQTQVVTIRRSVAQLVAEQCALCFQSANFVFQEKNKSMIYYIPEHDQEDPLKQPHCAEIQLKTESIYSKSWQN